VPPARFVTDTSLEFVAHRLSFLGYDIACLHGARLEELFEAGRREGRIVLTLSDRHPRRFADVTVIVAPRNDPAAALRRVAAEHQPASPPFGRCAACNQALQTRHPMEARGEVPGRVLRTVQSVRYCPMCGKWYWEGSHVARIRAWLEQGLGRALPGGAATIPEAGGSTPDS
jgi:uncharacterized protein with PIN domain